MDTDHLSWEDLRLLLAASRFGSLSELAREMNVDATTASRRLKALETAIDVSLFVRTRGKLELTHQARQLVRHAEQMEQAQLGFRIAAQGLKAAPAGIVRVSAPPTLARYALAPGVAVLHAQYPGLSIELEVEPANIRLERWEADVAVRLDPPLDAHDTLRTRRIGRMGYAVFGPANQPLPQRWIVYPRRFSHVPEAQWVERALEGTAPIMRANDPLAMAQAVASGAGRALLPELMGAALSGIEQHGDAVLHREVWLLRHPETGSMSSVQATCGWLIDLIRAVT